VADDSEAIELESIYKINCILHEGHTGTDAGRFTT
jgi:hypothetical protein